MPRKFRDLTPDELTAVRAFADAHGAGWKNKLNNVYWYNARQWRGPNGTDEATGVALHRLRNELGPRWLASFKLPPVAALTQTQAEVVATLRAGVERLKACTDNAMILAWDNGLGVGFTKGDRKAYACPLDIAEPMASATMPEEAFAFVPSVTNGAGIPARLVHRQEVLAPWIAQLEAALADIEARFAITP
jgi:hypothetical protein